MNFYSELNSYLIQFCSEESLKALVLVNKEFSSLSISEINERASRKLDIPENGFVKPPNHHWKYLVLISLLLWLLMVASLFFIFLR